jgi:hypothetical protein
VKDSLLPTCIPTIWAFFGVCGGEFAPTTIALHLGNASVIICREMSWCHLPVRPAEHNTHVSGRRWRGGMHNIPKVENGRKMYSDCRPYQGRVNVDNSGCMLLNVATRRVYLRQMHIVGDESEVVEAKRCRGGLTTSSRCLKFLGGPAVHALYAFELVV